MTHDFAKQRAARNARTGNDPAVPWGWLLSGIVIGAVFAFLVNLTLLKPPANGFQGNRPGAETVATQPRRAAEPARRPERRSSSTENPRAQPQFDFYDILRNTDGGPRPVPGSSNTATSDTSATPPVDVPEPMAARTAAADPTPASPKAPDAMQTAPGSASATSRLLLQAGAFSRSEDADRRRGELLLLGYDARVEAVRLPDGQTRYRVQIGPFADPQTRANAQRALHDVGIETL